MVRLKPSIALFLLFTSGTLFSKNSNFEYNSKSFSESEIRYESISLNKAQDDCSYTVNAGFDVITCESTSVQLNGETTSAGGNIVWTSSTGLGSFDNPAILNPIFTPDPQDNGSTISLIMTVTDGSCEISDDLTFTIYSIPIVSAGDDISICSSETIFLSGTVDQEGYTIEWEGGAGFFSNIFSTETTYIPSIFDPNPLVLTLTATDPVGTCAEVTSDITITFLSEPDVDAGSDEVICSGLPFDFSSSETVPTASEFTSLEWSHDGTGSFK